MSITDATKALLAVQINGDALMNCSPALKDEKDLVLVAVTTSVDALLWASPRLKEDREVLIQACTHFGRAIRYTKLLRSDPGVVFAAVKNDGNALQHVPTSSGLKNNFDVVATAIQSKPLSFQYASEEMRSNVELLVMAAKLDPKVLAAAATPEARSKAEAILENNGARWATSNAVYGGQ
jgi:hypothetical protein